MADKWSQYSNTHIKAHAGRVAVLMGGLSSERDISLLTGAAVHAALARQGIDAVAVDWRDDVVAALQAERFDRVFIALHGRGGEDGSIQGLLEVMGIPYTGSKVMASAIAMDKVRTKLLWQSLAVPTPEFAVVTPGDDAGAIVRSIGLPLMVKPAREGSSVGITPVTHGDELPAALELAGHYDDFIFVERYVAGREYSISLLNGQALPTIRIETPNGFYDYDAKYRSDETRYFCPCGLDRTFETALADVAILAFDAVGGSGWGRVDLLIDAARQAWFIDVNTVPGMTDHSLVPMAAKVAGIPFDDLVLRILGTSLA